MHDVHTEIYTQIKLSVWRKGKQRGALTVTQHPPWRVSAAVLLPFQAQAGEASELAQDIDIKS